MIKKQKDTNNKIAVAKPINMVQINMVQIAFFLILQRHDIYLFYEARQRSELLRSIEDTVNNHYGPVAFCPAGPKHPHPRPHDHQQQHHHHHVHSHRCGPPWVKLRA